MSARKGREKMVGIGEWPAERIRELRKKYGETREQFRTRLGVSVTTLQYWEQGLNEPMGPACVVLDRLEEDYINEDMRPLKGGPAIVRHAAVTEAAEVPVPPSTQPGSRSA